MNYGLYLSASGMQTSMYRMDVAANNLANLQTIGYKPDSAAVRQRDTAKIEDRLSSLPSNQLLEALGGGVLIAPNRVSTSQGSIESTPNPFDLAITGDGFFVVRDQSTGTAEDFKLSRDGRLTLNAKGQLVQASSGLPVLDTSDSPIVLNPAQPARIDTDGTIRQGPGGGAIIARIQIASIADNTQLRKAGQNLLSAPGELLARRTPSAAQLQQSAVERSAVDPIRATLAVSRAESGVSRAARMIQMHDEVMQRTISTFGRVG